jgi:hypothetical protein
MLEVGWRLLPDGSREREVLPEPQTELFFLDQLASVCQKFSPTSAESDQHKRKQAKARCDTFVNEYEAELMAVKDWERVSVRQRSPQGGEKNAVFTTKGYDRLKAALCGVETRACTTANASQGEQGGEKLQQKTKKTKKTKKKKKNKHDKSSAE